MFLVKVVRKAEKKVLLMPEHYRRRVRELTADLVNNPVPAEQYDVEKMEVLEEAYRIRIGDIRIIYRVLWSSHEIRVLEIEWRGSAY